ncbi:hypothetical protein E2C01_097723 [Portunus trituberculatus]|uniref:Uncharacterized protein n=1 Tax=Portunus trituberculatus TaxID=210409 RepID=A0A5B7JVY2_PORTR|nr:hypothetical protein [Portunus trituberculatus]
MATHICKWKICPCRLTCFYCRQKACGGDCCRPIRAPPSSFMADLVAAVVFALVLPYPLGRICGGGIVVMTSIQTIKDYMNINFGRCLHCKHFKHPNMPLFT